MFIESAIASGRNVLNVTCERRRRGLNYFSYSIVVVFLWENDVVFFFFLTLKVALRQKKKNNKKRVKRLAGGREGRIFGEKGQI